MRDSMKRRTFITGLAAIGSGLAPVAARAQGAWPQRPVTLIIPWAAGGATANIARIVGDEMAKSLGQPMIYEHRPGAGGALGSDLVAKARPDGYTLLIAGAGTFYRNALEKDVPYNAERDFSLIGPVGDGPFLLVTRQNMPAATLAELLDFSRRNPGKLTFGSAGAGSTSHLTGEFFKSVAKIDMTHVAYRGSGPALTDLLAGRIDMLFDPFPTTIENVRAGRIRAIGVTTAARHSLGPDIPTLAEAGLPQFVIAPWWGLIGPAGIPADAIGRLSEALGRALVNADVAAALAQQGVRPFAMNPQAFERYLRGEDARWRDVIRQAGLTPA
jgi:tripartite-type tricarboxylate transporter receptor subunit TctC